MYFTEPVSLREIALVEVSPLKKMQKDVRFAHNATNKCLNKNNCLMFSNPMENHNRAQTHKILPITSSVPYAKKT